MSPLTLHQIVAAARGRRHALGWSQQELATRAGVSRYWVASFEGMNGGASLDAVLRVLDVLGLPLMFHHERPEARTAADPGEVIDLDEIIEQHSR